MPKEDEGFEKPAYKWSLRVPTKYAAGLYATLCATIYLGWTRSFWPIYARKQRDRAMSLVCALLLCITARYNSGHSGSRKERPNDGRYATEKRWPIILNINRVIAMEMWWYEKESSEIIPSHCAREMAETTDHILRSDSCLKNESPWKDSSYQGREKITFVYLIVYLIPTLPCNHMSGPELLI